MSSPRSFATAKIQQIFVICKELTIKMEFTHIFPVFFVLCPRLPNAQFALASVDKSPPDVIGHKNSSDISAAANMF